MSFLPWRGVLFIWGRIVRGGGGFMENDRRSLSSLKWGDGGWLWVRTLITHECVVVVFEKTIDLSVVHVVVRPSYVV